MAVVRRMLRLGQNGTALEALKKALELNDTRLAKVPKAKDIRETLANDARFSKLRETAELKALTPSK